MANPNSVLVHPLPSQKALKNKPNVCLPPIEIQIILHAAIKTINAILLGINLNITLCILKIFLSHRLNL